jgi:hypothetical protein
MRVTFSPGFLSPGTSPLLTIGPLIPVAAFRAFQPPAFVFSANSSASTRLPGLESRRADWQVCAPGLSPLRVVPEQLGHCAELREAVLADFHERLLSCSLWIATEERQERHQQQGEEAHGGHEKQEDV